MRVGRDRRRQPSGRARPRTPGPASRRPGRRPARMLSRSSASASSLSSRFTVFDSTLARSRMSFRSLSRSPPEERMTLAYSTWRVGQVAVGVVLELLGQHQQAVERRAQLVRHVGDELRLVPRRDRELGGLLLDEPLGLLDLLVLAPRPRCSCRPAAWPARRDPRSTGAAAPAATAAPGPATATARAASR